MGIKVDVYQIVLRFRRLFPDPAVFEDQKHLAAKYLNTNGLSPEKSRLVFQITDEIVAVDDRGVPAAAAGTAKFLFEGRTIWAEYMSNANVRIGYVDFGTGLSADEYSRLWSKGKLGELRFELREFKHNRHTLNIPEVSELYSMLRDRATPSTLSTIELEGVPRDLFEATFSYVERRLKEWAEADGFELEIYAAQNLSPSEKASLERRLTRESTKSTVFVILSRPVAKVQPYVP
jgi:hypothetical protein